MEAEAVRKSEAPRVPPFAIDVVGRGGSHIYTIAPPTEEAQLRWVCVISRGIAFLVQAGPPLAFWFD